jgi:hypothetical protein
MSRPTIRFQPTPNPNAGKFTADRPVVEGKDSKSFYSADQAEPDAVARALFALPGVQSLFMVEDFVTVTKTPEADWGALIPLVENAMAEAMT